MNEETKQEKIKEVKENILKAMKKGGIYMNNVVGSILRDVSATFDEETADQIVIDMNLEELIGIPPVNKRTR